MPDGNDPQILAIAIELETAVWDALVRGDQAADADALAEDFLGVYPTGFADKKAHTDQLIDGPTVAEYQIVAPTVRTLAPGVLLLAYDARYRRTADHGSRQDADPPPSMLMEQMYVSSIWVQHDERWTNVFSQDTPATDIPVP